MTLSLSRLRGGCQGSGVSSISLSERSKRFFSLPVYWAKELIVANKLAPKDLITVGLFTALYFVLFFATGLVGYIPVLMLALPFLVPFVTGIPFMLFLTKVKTFGMVSIMAILLSLLMFITGHSWIVLGFGIVFGLSGDLILRSGKYKRWASTLLGYIVFSEWVMGGFAPVFIMRDSYIAHLREGYGDTYANIFNAIMPNWVLPILVALVALGAICGAFLGKAVLKKHFARAGIA